MAMIGKVRRMHHRQKKSVREIARATSLSRNTVRKYLRAEEVHEPRYRRESPPTKLTPFHDAVLQALKADLHRPRRERGGRRARCTPSSRPLGTAAATAGSPSSSVHGAKKKVLR